MKARAESLRSAREKERQIIANEKLHEHWIANDPDLRSIEQQKLENRQPEYWSEQVNQKRLVQQEEEDENLKYQKIQFNFNNIISGIMWCIVEIECSIFIIDNIEINIIAKCRTNTASD